MFFSSWSDIGRVAIVTAVVFFAVVAMLRVVGQQALAKMSSFDIVFSVTMGSVVANVAVTRDITVVQAVVAIGVLLTLQECVRRFQARSLRIHHIVRQPPRVVLWDGVLLEDRLRDVSTSADEVRAAVRKAGLRSLSEARLVVLENDGQWSVVAKIDEESDESAFYGLPIPGRPDNSPVEDGMEAVAAPADRLP